LSIDEFAPVIKDKIRAAAGARLPASRRLKDRLRFRAGGLPAARIRATAAVRTTQRRRSLLRRM